MSFSLRVTYGVALAVTTAVVASSGTVAASTAAEPDPFPAPTWSPQARASVDARPAAVLAGTDTTEKVRIVTVRAVDGRPSYSVETTTTPAAATAAVERGQDAPGAVSVSVDTRVHVTVTRANDTFRNQQWPLDTLGAESLWETQSGAGVVVGVVDSGVQGSHDDLAGVVLAGKDYVNTGLDGRTDEAGHGTHVAGIIGAVANNAKGVAGLAQGVRILPVRALDADGAGWASDLAAGIVYAVDHGAQVVNLSVGGGPDDSEQVAVSYALSKKVVVVAAAGNERETGNPDTYPADYPGVIGVAATDQADGVAPFSNTGSYVDIAAPGVDVASTYPANRYAYLSGTSMAAPYVAAAAALLKAARPTATPAEIENALESTALDLGPSGRDDDFGYGLLQPAAALEALIGTPATPTPTPTPAPTPVPATPPAPLAPAPTAVVLGGPASALLGYGGRLAGTARVLDATTGAPLASVPAQVCRRTAPAAAAVCTPVTADAAGTVSWAWPATANTEVYVTYAGTPTTAAATSDPVRYAVAARVTASTARTGRSHDQRVVVSVLPAGRSSVHLQVRRGSRWAAVRGATTSPAGTVTLRRLPPGRYRAVTGATATNAGGTSRTVRVR